MKDQIEIRTGEQIDIEIDSSTEQIDLDISTPVEINIDIDDKIKVQDYEKLSNLPKINGHTVIGKKTPADYGIKEDAYFVFTQQTPSDLWFVQHNLGKKPAITVSDSAGTIVIGSYRYLDDNNVILQFEGAFSGKAYFN